MPMKIYTKTGDAGETGLCNGERVPKTDPRICACGTLDELNCLLGEIHALQQIQRDLFNIGSVLAKANIEPAFDVAFLESEIDRMDKDLPELKTFILPGGCETAAKLHIARAVCRRAERAVLKIAKQKTTTSKIIQYLNRLSDFLFVLARYTNYKSGVADVEYH